MVLSFFMNMYFMIKLSEYKYRFYNRSSCDVGYSAIGMVLGDAGFVLCLHFDSLSTLKNCNYYLKV